jgi:hypothetical protein
VDQLPKRESPKHVFQQWLRFIQSAQRSDKVLAWRSATCHGEAGSATTMQGSISLCGRARKTFPSSRRGQTRMAYLVRLPVCCASESTSSKPDMLGRWLSFVAALPFHERASIRFICCSQTSLKAGQQLGHGRPAGLPSDRPDPTRVHLLFDSVSQDRPRSVFWDLKIPLC